MLATMPELQVMFKTVLRKIRPASLYCIRDATTGVARDYVFGRDGLLDENDYVEQAIWRFDNRPLDHNGGWGVILRLNPLNGGIYVETSPPHTIREWYEVAGVSGQFIPGTGPHLVVPTAEHLGGALADFVDRAYEIYQMQLAKLH